ncbi:Spy/CpxP family protein refolding chaperone [Rhodocyclus tenuis]|uniref:Spy/CpxP family protein refolding chaperone n=1 Tax=Rhodocyclus tenuis TaxID=1066 RepID=UPI0019032CF8|nr:Spy/CpxP family protein refolding chaperone [Rhodocyclus tenuis]MBK1680365.1 hypothetical protein [Rhodocyclus tenuis]
MNTFNSSSNPAVRRFLAAAALGLGLGAAGASFAVTPGPGENGAACGEWNAAQHHARHGRDFGRSLARLHDELKLDAKQEALWKTAEQSQREARKDVGERLRDEQRKTLAALDAPGADLRSLLARMDELRAEGDKRRLAERERWLAVYDSLNPTQQEQARAFLRKLIDGGNRQGPADERRGPPRR